MAVDAFLKLGDIKGESQDAKFLDWIDVLEYSWGVTNSGDLESPGRAEAQDFHFMHTFDRASPILFQHCVDGEHIPDGQLAVRTSGEKPAVFLTLKFYDILLGSVQDAASDERPTESVAFAYNKVVVEYRMQNPDGSLQAPITATGDFSKKPG